MKMKTNVHYHSVMYYYGENTAVCKLKFYIDLDKIENMRELMKLNSVKNFIYDFTDYDDRYGCGKIYFDVVGKSKASGGDVFDKDLGKKVALTRAQENAFDVAGSFYCALYNIVAQSLNHINTLCCASRLSATKCCLHTDDLLAKYLEDNENEE